MTPKRKALDKLLDQVEQKMLDLYGMTYRKVLNLDEVRMAIRSGDEEFSFKKHSAAAKKVERLIETLANNLSALTINGVMGAFGMGEKDAWDNVVSLLGTSRLSSQAIDEVRQQATNQHRESAMNARQYVNRKRGGFSVSDRIWRTTRQSAQEMEITIQNGIIEGQSAEEISRGIRGNLLEPHRLFRSVRDKETGQLRLSKAAKEYHPGAGVYRSSYKNAMRVARSEVNNAYRSAEWQSYSGNMVVKGYEIRLSNNHTTLVKGKPVPFHDICDELAGVYPKDFQWSGWHPQCRCSMIPIPLTPKELGEYMKAKREGKRLPNFNVKDVPENYKEWIIKNADRIAVVQSSNRPSKRLPYFLQDNADITERILHPKSIKELADERHAARTQEQIDDIKRRWAERNDRMDKARIERVAEERHAARTQSQIDDIRRRWAERNERMDKARIERVAEGRHAARTQSQIDDIRRRWAERNERMDKARIERVAEERHAARTQSQIEDIKRRWTERNERMNRVRIERIAEKRHKERTKKREAEIRAFWAKKRAEGDERRHREEILAKAEARHAARTQKEIQNIIDKRNAELAQFAEWEKTIRDTEVRAQTYDWLTDEEKVIWVDGPGGTRNHLDKYYISAKRLGERMDVIDAMRPEWNRAAQHTSVFGIYQEKLDEARRMITNGFGQKATDVLSLMKKIEDIEPRYVDMRTYQSTHPGKGGKKSKIEVALDEAEELIKNGDIKGAEMKIEEAEKTRKINEASALAKAEAARRKKEEEAKKKAEAEEGKSKKLKHEDCVTIEDFRELYGDDMPVITKNIENSVKRNQYTDKEYLADREEIERKLKEFWKKVDFSHCTNPYVLDGYFKDGILTNLQRNGDTNTGYAATRRSYGHFAYDLPGNPGIGFSKIPKQYHLKPGEYYRCGVPCSKDPYEAFVRDNSGYGDAQLVFRRDRIITTFTMGNSLSQETIPSLTSDPKVCSFDGKYVRNYKNKEYTIESLRSGNGYCEVQYLPLKSQGNFTPKDFERITLKNHPEQYHKKELWEKWANEGVDIYYIDYKNNKAVLYMKGKPQMTNAEAKVKLEGSKKELDVLFSDEAKFSNKDVSIKAIQDKMKSGDYLGALEDFEKYNSIEARKAKLKGLIPDADKWHKQFTIEELESAHRAIEAKVDYMDNTFKARNAPDDVLKKWAEEIDKAEHPDKYKSGAKRFPTWKIAKEAYERKRNELVYEFHKVNIDNDLNALRGFKTKNKAFNAKIQELEAKVSAKEWADVETIISEAKDIMKGLGERILMLGESNAVKFSASEFAQAKKDVAKWFKDTDVQKAYKEADDYMSKYAQEMWKNLGDEEKHILWLYSDGSKYINDEMLGTYSLKCISPIDGSVRNGLADANVLTSIIEKAPALKESMWMQSGKSAEAFRAMFGVDIRGVNDLSRLVGKEGFNSIFSSCHASSDGYFTKGGSTGVSNPVVMSIYMPAGTKGVYMEPFASYGDKLRWKKGVDWTGTKRREAPSDQVEFLLQRGAKFKITNAYYKDGKWYVDVDLIEQTAVDAINTNIPGLMNRRERTSRKPTLI